MYQSNNVTMNLIGTLIHCYIGTLSINFLTLY